MTRNRSLSILGGILTLACALFSGAPSHVGSASLLAGMAPVPSGEIYYEVAGSGEPIILIHGNAGDLRHWDRQVDALATRYRVVRYDVRGFGRSSDPVENGACSHHGDLAALMDQLEIPRAHVMGWSMGSGMSALLRGHRSGSRDG